MAADPGQALRLNGKAHGSPPSSSFCLLFERSEERGPGGRQREGLGQKLQGLGFWVLFRSEGPGA